MNTPKITLTRNMLSMISPDDVLAYAWSSPGAMGPEGTFRILLKDGRMFEADYLYGDITVEDLKPHLPTNEIMDTRYMGLGNNLFLRSEDAAWFDTELERYEEEAFYPNVSRFKHWVEICRRRIIG